MYFIRLHFEKVVLFKKNIYLFFINLFKGLFTSKSKMIELAVVVEKFAFRQIIYS